MSAQGLEVIDQTVQLTHEWINELRGRLDWDSSRDAARLLRVTLTLLRDHLQHEEVAQWSAQMPLLIRGMFFEGWQPARTPLRDKRAAYFVAAIEAQLREVRDWRGREDILTVCRPLDHRISEGEIREVKAGLPQAIRDLWPTEGAGRVDPTGTSPRTPASRNGVSRRPATPGSGPSCPRRAPSAAFPERSCRVCAGS